MIQKILILLPSFYFFALIQTAFLFSLPLILILIILINLFENPRDFSGIFAGMIGGFFLDIFSSGIIGLQVVILVFLSLFIKLILKRYV